MPHTRASTGLTQSPVITGIPVSRPYSSSSRQVASDSNPLPASHRFRTTPASGPWIRRKRNPGSRPRLLADGPRQRRAEGIVHDRDLARQAELELGAREPGGHRVSRQVAPRAAPDPRTDGLLVARPPGASRSSRSCRRRGAPAPRPARGSRTSSTRSREGADPRRRPGRRSGCAGTRARPASGSARPGGPVRTAFADGGRRAGRGPPPPPPRGSDRRGPRWGSRPASRSRRADPRSATPGSSPQRQPFWPGLIARPERGEGRGTLTRISVEGDLGEVNPGGALSAADPHGGRVTHEVTPPAELWQSAMRRLGDRSSVSSLFRAPVAPVGAAPSAMARPSHLRPANDHEHATAGERDGSPSSPRDPGGPLTRRGPSMRGALERVGYEVVEVAGRGRRRSSVSAIGPTSSSCRAPFPDMDLLDFCVALRKDPVAEKLPFVLVAEAAARTGGAAANGRGPRVPGQRGPGRGRRPAAPSLLISRPLPDTKAPAPSTRVE